MKFKQKATLALAVIALTASNLVAAQTTLLNVSYDVAREFYKDINTAFVANYKKTTGKDIKIDQSHAGSSAQARAVNDGLEADVVTMNTTTDVDFLASTGVVAKDWTKKFPNNAAPTSSTMLFLVRSGNPKGIKDWDDLVKPGIQVIVVNPKTGGNGRMAYLAAWGQVRKKGGTDAQAAEFVRGMPDGLNSTINQGGSNVSGGQRQRLAIARALVHKPEIYLFDDSFSALDLSTDARLRAALAPHTTDSIVLLVAQRVSTISRADQILVLENGETVGLGTHEQLLETCPTYAEIVASQIPAEEVAA